MATSEVHQFLVSATPGDAIYNHAILIRRWLREWGFRSDVYAESVAPFAAREGVLPRSRFSRKNDASTVVIYHYSTGSPLSAFVAGLRNRIVLVYHNVTPSEYFRGVQQQMFERTLRGRQELVAFRDVSQAIAVSEFNRQELDDLGFRRTAVVPLALDEERYAVSAADDVLARFRDERTNLLFVGRVVPNKRHEDLLAAYYHYRRVNPRSRLMLVGGWDASPRYKDWLGRYAEHLGLSDVHFCGRVSTEQLVAYYRVAHIFVSMSAHEGFCVPLVESMYFGVPVIAYAAAAIPSTLGSSGILVRRKQYDLIAEMIHLLATDEDLRARVIAQQKRRYAEFAPGRVKQALRTVLEPILA